MNVRITYSGIRETGVYSLPMMLAHAVFDAAVTNMKTCSSILTWQLALLAPAVQSDADNKTAASDRNAACGRDKSAALTVSQGRLPRRAVSQTGTGGRMPCGSCPKFQNKGLLGTGPLTNIPFSRFGIRPCAPGVPFCQPPALLIHGWRLAICSSI